MIWRFSDGTTAELGGKIEGASWFAQHLRSKLTGGAPLFVGTHPPPQRGTPLDANDPTLFDLWLTRWANDSHNPSPVRMVERPAGIPPFPELTDDELGRNAPADALF